MIAILLCCIAVLAIPTAPRCAPHPDATATSPATPDSASMRTIGAALDAWHRAAAAADGPAFFGFMDERCVYFGTDAAERWTKAAFVAFAQPFFERGKAWDFTPRDRTVRLLGHDLALFDESLDTWMGVCRGTGALRRTKAGWRLLSYHLAMTIPNERVREVLTLLGGNGRKP
jgi:hypothetical protein